MKPVTKTLILAVVIALALSACNLGNQGNSPEPTLAIDSPEVVPPQTTDDGGEGEGATDVGTTDGEITPPETTDDGGSTDVGQEGPPPTSTTAAQPANDPSTQISSISVVGQVFTTQEPVTIQVERGSAVSNLNCSITLQDTGETALLTDAVSQQLNDTTFRETYTYTPTRAGNYTVNCNGIATTGEGQQSVSRAGDPFSVEAKG